MGASEFLPYILAGKFFAQHIYVRSIGQSRIPGDFSCTAKVQKTGIHGNHRRIVHGRIKHTVNLRDFIITDHIPDSRSHSHDFKCSCHFSVCGWDKLLGNYGLEYHRKLNGNLPLLVRRKYVNDTVNGIGGSYGVQGRND